MKAIYIQPTTETLVVNTEYIMEGAVISINPGGGGGGTAGAPARKGGQPIE